MAITKNQTQQPMGTSKATHGYYIDTGTVTAFDLTIGYNPRYVCVENVTDRTKMEWYEGMDDASAIKTVANGTRTLITTHGITVDDGVVTVGLDTDVVVTSKQLAWKMTA